MSPAPRADPELDDLIAETTVDCYDEDEGLIGFENAFDEAGCFPCPGAVVGAHVEVLSVAAGNGRRELIATCKRDGRRHQIALLDIDIHTDQPASRLVLAYRRWLGVESNPT
ncbi:MAG: hypothetical protein H0X55_09475 [Thermoleophilaceae bacterium]|jgi:hypothetical protein|nr:hypothetical protein [Thermoleophilaceae bacterium]